MKLNGIYKITNLLNGKVYIGKSKDLLHRWTSHKSQARNANHKSMIITKKLKEYGIENFKFEIIKETYDLDYWERFFIWWYKSNIARWKTEANGYNMSDGGEEGWATIPWNKGKTNCYSEETRKKMGYWKNKKKPPCTEETRKKLRNALMGKKLPHDVKQKISIALQGKCYRNNFKPSDPIKCIETGKIYSSITEAYKELHITNIYKVLKGERKTAGKLHWVWADKNKCSLGSCNTTAKLI